VWGVVGFERKLFVVEPGLSFWLLALFCIVLALGPSSMSYESHVERETGTKTILNEPSETSHAYVMERHPVFDKLRLYHLSVSLSFSEFHREPRPLSAIPFVVYDVSNLRACRNQNKRK